jgi:large subunit ribosomal protein L32
MAHPKTRVSKQRKRKRRTHYKAVAPNVATCPTTGAPHLFHRAYKVEGDLYYRGRILVKGNEVTEVEE